MTAQPKSVIKSYFQSGDKPTEQQFIDLIDSYQDFGTFATDYYVDTGTANNYIITTIPATTSYDAGDHFTVKILNTNNGTSTLDAGAGPLTIVYIDGTTLNPGALPAGGIALFYTDMVNWYLVNILPTTAGTKLLPLPDKSAHCEIGAPSPEPEANDIEE